MCCFRIHTSKGEKNLSHTHKEDLGTSQGFILKFLRSTTVLSKWKCHSQGVFLQMIFGQLPDAPITYM